MANTPSGSVRGEVQGERHAVERMKVGRGWLGDEGVLAGCLVVGLGRQGGRRGELSERWKGRIFCEGEVPAVELYVRARCTL